MSPVAIVAAPVVHHVRFRGGPLDGEVYPLRERPTWLWFEERQEPDVADVFTRPVAWPLLYPRRFHRYELMNGCYEHTRIEEDSITVFTGDAWLDRARPHVRRVGAGGDE